MVQSVVLELSIILFRGQIGKHIAYWHWHWQSTWISSVERKQTKVWACHKTIWPVWAGGNKGGASIRINGTGLVNYRLKLKRLFNLNCVKIKLFLIKIPLKENCLIYKIEKMRENYKMNFFHFLSEILQKYIKDCQKLKVLPLKIYPGRYTLYIHTASVVTRLIRITWLPWQLNSGVYRNVL